MTDDAVISTDPTGGDWPRSGWERGVAWMARLHAMLGEQLGEDTETVEVALGIETDHAPADAHLRTVVPGESRRRHDGSAPAESMTRSRPVPNIFACLVHEAPDCITDLVMNLRCLDPESQILLYDGSARGRLLDTVRLPGENVHVHPGSRPMRWGVLHGFALDCMRHALAEIPFAAMTIVDSDQLLLRSGYSQRLAEVLADTPGVGCLINVPNPPARPAVDGPAAAARGERRRWQPYLRRFPSGEELFPQWTFWPGTVFTAGGARRLLELWDDPELARLVAGTGIIGTEEIILPTLVALSGAGVAPTPFRRDCLQFRRSYSIVELERVARLDDAFWLHPAPRVLDDPVRAWVRKRYAGYQPIPVT